MKAFCMTRRAALAALAAALAFPAGVRAEREELSDGRFVDEHGDIHDSKYPNEDFAAPWNDQLKRDDPFAPWNDPLKKDDPFAPWNDPMAGPRETNRHLRDQGEKNSDWYWK